MRVQVLAVFGIVVQAASLNAADWRVAAERVSPSVVYVENKDGACTGFVINSQGKDNTDLILTAAHCFGERLFADGAAATVIWKDTKHDLMIVAVEDTERPAVVFAKANPVQGEEIASYGYGYALEKPMLRIAHVSNAAIDIPELEGGPFVMIDAGYVGGQSGGPCVNAAGEIVSIVQQANGLVGIGVGTETIRKKAGRYFERRP